MCLLACLLACYKSCPVFGSFLFFSLQTMFFVSSSKRLERNPSILWSPLLRFNWIWRFCFLLPHPVRMGEVPAGVKYWPIAAQDMWHTGPNEANFRPSKWQGAARKTVKCNGVLLFWAVTGTLSWTYYTTATSGMYPLNRKCIHTYRERIVFVRWRTSGKYCTLGIGQIIDTMKRL